MELFLLTNIDFDTIYNFLLFSEIIDSDFNFVKSKIKLIIYNCKLTKLEEQMLRNISNFYFLESIIRTEVYPSYQDCSDRKTITYNCQLIKPRENKTNYYVQDNWLILFNPNIKNEKQIKEWLLNKISSYYRIDKLINTDQKFWRNLMNIASLDDTNLENVYMGIYGSLILIYIQDEYIKHNNSFFKPAVQYIKIDNPIPQQEFKIVKLEEKKSHVFI